MSPFDPKVDSLEMLVLAVLAGEPLYGYGIIKRLAAGSGGEVRVSPGVLYPLLALLEKDGLIQATWETVRSERATEEDSGGRRRKWYTLSDRGRRRLSQRIAAHRAYHAMIEGFLSTGTEGGAAS